jgi:hypothetical protein
MTLTKFARPTGSLALRLAAVAAAASLLGLGACNEAFIPNYNFPTSIAKTELGFTNAVFGVYNGRGDAGNWATWTSGMSREASYFTNSESRFLSELTGKFAIQPDDFIGGTVWDNEFDLVKTADTAQAIIPSLVASGAQSPAQGTASWGVVETGKALNYMYPAMSRDSLGVPINAVGQTTPPYAPVLCNQLVWASIIAMLDSAIDSLNTAGSGTGLISLPAGLASVASTAGTFESLTLALRAKARIEYAYAVTRAGGSPLVTLTGAPAAQLDSAQADIQAVSFYTPSTALTSAEAVMPNDAGVFFAYSTQGNDITNPIFGFISGYNALKVFVDSVVAPGDTIKRIDTLDNRFTAKFVHIVDSHNHDVIPKGVYDSMATAWNYSNNLTGSTPLPIVRNVELQFMFARTQIGLGDLAGAVSTLNDVRTLVGGVAPATVALNPTAVALFFINEARMTFIAEGTGEDLIAIRDFGLGNTVLTTWGSADTKATVLPIPITETQPRNGDVTPDCTGAASHSAPAPKAVKVAPKATNSVSGGRIIKLH